MSAPDTYRFLLRMPQELKEPLRAAAEANGRSLNAEIVARLTAGAAPPRARRARLVPAIAAAVVLGAATGNAYAELRPAGVNDGAAALPLPKRALVTEQPSVTEQLSAPTR